VRLNTGSGTRDAIFGTFSPQQRVFGNHGGMWNMLAIGTNFLLVKQWYAPAVLDISNFLAWLSW